LATNTVAQRRGCNERERKEERDRKQSQLRSRIKHI
jgi:hypothetical protein